MYRASVNLAKLSLMAVSCSPRPSAASRLSRGMVYPLGFFQLEMLGGIFQSCWSLTLTGRGGECMMGTGGEPAPLGTCKEQVLPEDECTSKGHKDDKEESEQDVT